MLYIQFFTYNKEFDYGFCDYKFQNLEDLEKFFSELKKCNNIYKDNNGQIFLILNNPQLLPTEELKKIHNKNCMGYSIFNNREILYKYKDHLGYWSKEFITYLEKIIAQERIKKILNNEFYIKYSL
jgi:hypothetical protein